MKKEEEKEYAERIRPKHEEFTDFPNFLGWILLFALSVVILGWGMLIMMVIMDRPRDWNFGALPQTPAESFYTTELPQQPAKAPEQIPPLPERRQPERPESSKPFQ
jgi:hypothetical protein